MRKISSSKTVAQSAAGMIVVMLMATSCSKASDSAETTTPPTPAPEARELFTQPLQAAPVAQDPATVLVTVNGKDITAGELDKELATMMDRMQGRVPPERMAQMQMQMRDQLLDNLITRDLLLAKVKEEKIEVSDEEFTAAVSEFTANLPPGASLDDMLAQTGTSQEEFKETFGMELQVRKLIESHTGGKAEATEEEVQKFYDENKERFERPESVSARHILISIDPGDNDEQKAAKRKELEDIRKQIEEGADFAAMAGEHSTCPSKAQGGDLGTFDRGRMVPEFETAAFTQEVGQVGDIVETQFGYHIIKVEKREEASVMPLDDVKEQLSQGLANQKYQKAAQGYVQELRAGADIKYPGK